MAPPSFQNQGALSSNYQGNTRYPGFNELLLVMNDMKRSNDTRVTRLENSQINMTIVIKNMENIHSTMGSSVRKLETHHASFNVTMKNLDTQMRQIAQSLKQSFSKHFPSDTETNPK